MQNSKTNQQNETKQKHPLNLNNNNNKNPIMCKKRGKSDPLNPTFNM